ncbi:MAG: hypothetical protein KGH63_05025, partial [Candidatus Micrarchaeota archaeon]|nr:hypothetical protein [Candidatus Micrarchaeota archaeon]
MKPTARHPFFVAILVAALISLSALAYAQSTTNFDLISRQTTGTGFFAQNWFQNWQYAGLAAVFVMVALIALAYMAGQMLQIEDLKHFARSELVQAGASVLLLLLILVLLGIADRTMAAMTSPGPSQIFSPCQTGLIPACPTSGAAPASPISCAPALNQYAYCYVNNLKTIASAQGDAIIRDSVQYAAEAYRSVGFSTDQWFLLYVSATYRPDAYLRLDSEVKGQEFTLLSAFLISLQGQLYFLQYIVPVLGPALLLLGVVLRCLAFTRRLGGLLIAAGLGLMIVLPATYLLAWFTLQVAVVGPQQAAGAAPSTTCP